MKHTSTSFIIETVCCCWLFNFSFVRIFHLFPLCVFFLRTQMAYCCEALLLAFSITDNLCVCLFISFLTSWFKLLQQLIRKEDPFQKQIPTMLYYYRTYKRKNEHNKNVSLTRMLYVYWRKVNLKINVNNKMFNPEYDWIIIAILIFKIYTIYFKIKLGKIQNLMKSFSIAIIMSNDTKFCLYHKENTSIVL